MRILLLVILIMSWISLSACSHISGNVVPEKGPTMEQIYDGIKSTPPLEQPSSTRMPHLLPMHTVDNAFHKIPNPELKMYVFPHVAGKEEVPIPGYETAFNAYTQDHYALPNEI